MATFSLTGVDPSDPTPGFKREIAPARGSSGGATRARDIVIFANMATGTGSGSVDGIGEALNTPRLIGGGEDDVIQRAGYKSEALLLYKTGVRHNKEAQFWLCLVAPGTGAATVDFTFATAADRVGTVRIELIGETVDVPVISGDSVTTVAGLVQAAIDAQLHWPVTASNVAGVVTVTAAVAGTRFDHYINKMRISFLKPNSMTVTKGVVTGGSTDDDQTTAISNTVGLFDIYYQVNPKQTTAGVTSTDNGIGEHVTAVTDAVAPTSGKAAVVVFGMVGTPTQAVTTMTSVNQWYAFGPHTEGNDFSAGMIAVTFAAVLAKKEASDRAASLVDYGVKDSSDTLYIPDPYSKADRPTASEIKTLLNNGVTPIAFTSSGKPYIVRHITGKSLTNSVNDYRVRPGHLPSVLFDFAESLRNEYNATVQPKVADDPLDGERRLAGFTYPKDVKGMVSKLIDLKIDGQAATLDPSARQAMKDSIVVERLVNGCISRFDLAAVRHFDKGQFLINEVSPPI